MDRYVVGLDEIDRMQVALVGGKGAGLGELMRIEGVRVPPGFCVTTAAFGRILGSVPAVDELLGRLQHVRADDRATIGALGAELRAAIETAVIPDDLAQAVTRAVATLGEDATCAVRSSATAEDMPTASFAGQHATWLNITGAGAILQHVRRCWASLHTDRAMTYRARNGIDHRAVRMAVVVQRMVPAQASGILFTADPLTGNRKVASVEATSGLGEALVSGVVDADGYKVREGEVIETTLRAEPRVALTEAQVVRLVEQGRRIEAHFGGPQDIEWCLADGNFHVVQSRPITTLFPVPASADGGNHVYVSVGHQQMMTDAMKPLGLSFWQMTTPRPMAEAGGRLFVDVTPMLAAPASRAALLDLMEKSDPLIRDAIDTVLARDGFVPSLPDAAPAWTAPSAGPAPLEADPTIVAGLIAQSVASIEAAKREIATKSGPALMGFIEADMQELRRILYDPRSRQVYMSAMEAAWWLNDRLQAWLGEKNAADVLTQSVPNNVTSEMGLALLDVADAVRPHVEVVRFLERVDARDSGFLDTLPALAGGRDARAAILAWLERYGMRCVGEIDITRPRWSERPGTLLPLILANVRNFEHGEAARRFERGRAEASAKEHELLARLRVQPDGDGKAEEAKRMIARVRTFIGYREYPKYGMISRYFIYRQALLREAGRLVDAGVLREAEDIHYLDFQELREVVRTRQVDERVIHERREAFRGWQALTPPRVLTSEGEGVNGAYRRDDVPPGALAGLAVSAGTVEGRARIVRDIDDADLAPGDILVTASTDPSWTPLFVAIAGLVTEVGGLMTHGAVIAREYGLPAVVGVQGATRLIRDGQRIRVHGTEGYVEILDRHERAGIEDAARHR